MKAKIATELVGYKEEMEASTIGINNYFGSSGGKTITAFGSDVKKYIPSILDKEIGDYAIIGSELWYLGNNELIREVAISHKIKVIPDEKTLADYQNDLEDKAVSSIVNSEGDKICIKKDEFGNKVKIGEELKNKTLNAIDWNLVTEVVNNELIATYGDGWRYVPAGETIDILGKLKNAYIINFNEKKVVQFDNKKHSKMSIDDVVVAKDNIIFNADPSIMEKYNNLIDKTKFDSKSLGGDIEFIGYNGIDGKVDYNKAFTSSSFEFDGEDDYLKIKFDDTVLSKEKKIIKDENENNVEVFKNQKEVFAENGFTFQFYGILKGGKVSHWNDDGTLNWRADDVHNGLFGLWNGNVPGEHPFRVLRENNDKVLWNAGFGNYPTDFSHPGSKWNQLLSINSFLNYNKVINFCIVLNIKDLFKKDGDDNNYYRQTLYINGEKTNVNGGYRVDGWNYFINDNPNNSNDLNHLSSCNYFCIGAVSYGGAKEWHFSKMSCYSIKLYNKALTDEQILESYKKDVAYHEFLENGGIAETGGDTGGIDISNVQNNP